MNPRVSVVIDNYNYGRFLAAAIDSALAQDLPAGEFEVIVVDDGSTDESRAVLARYQGRVRAVLQENAGYAAAFNRGVAEARAEIVSFLDSDDVWRPDKLRRVLARFDREPDLAAVQHLLDDTDANLIVRPSRFPAWPERYVLEDYLEGRVVLGATSGLSFRKATLADAFPLPTAFRCLYADDYLTVRALFKGAVGNIAEPLGCHRVHGANSYAGLYGDVRKLELDLKLHAIFREGRDRWLREAGRELSPRSKQVENLEVMRRAILACMYRGERVAALVVWAHGLMHYGSSAFGLFRVLTCAAALVSPSLYLSLYGLYSSRNGALSWRSRWLPS